MLVRVLCRVGGYEEDEKKEEMCVLGCPESMR